MKGLILKDLFLIARSAKLMACIVVLYFIIGMLNSDFSFAAGFVGSVLVMVFSMFTMTTVSLDEKARWDCFALSAPVDRRQLVLSKYLLNGVLILLGTLISLVLIGVLGIVKGEMIWEEVFLVLLTMVLVVLVFNSLLLPITFRYGPERSRIILFVLVLAGMAAIGLLTTRIDLGGIHLGWLYSVGPIAAVLMYVVSYCISCRIYQKKEIG